MNHSIEALSKPSRFIIIAVPIALYCLVYMIRVSPSALKEYLIFMFGINMLQFGIFSSCSYWSYTPMQLFAGPIIDQFGPKIAILFACLLISIGMLLVGYTNYFFITIFAFILMGIGSAFAFPSVLKVSLDLFPDQTTLVAGIATSIGVAGAILGQTLLYQGLHNYGHVILSSIAIVICMVLALITWNFFYSEANKPTEHTDSVIEILRNTANVLSNKTVILSGIIGMCYLMPINTFASVWAISYFEQVYVLDVGSANDASTYIYYGWIAGCLSVNLISKYCPRIILLSIGGIAAAISFSTLVYFPFNSLFEIKILLITTGFFLGVQVLIFSISSQAVQSKLAATAICCTNMLCMLSGFLQPVIGYILDLHWDGVIINEMKVFSETGFQNALLIIPVLLIVGSFMSLLIKEKHEKY